MFKMNSKLLCIQFFSVISGYNPFVVFFTIGVIILISSITVFRHFKRTQKKCKLG